MSIQISRGIQLPAFDVKMLSLGKLIAIPFKQYLKEGEAFWLHPSQQIPLDMKLEEYYKPEYLDASREATSEFISPPIAVRIWGVCDYHWHIYPKNKHLLFQIAQSAIWNLNALEQIFEQNQVLKILFLRAFCLPIPCVSHSPKQVGSFFWFGSEDEVIQPSEQDIPVVSKSSFEQRKTLLMSGKDYPYKALEVLQEQVERSTHLNVEARLLDSSIKQILGWVNNKTLESTNPEWMNTIAALGDRSVKEDEGKSNYQAGTDFEIIIRRSLEFLGFKIDYSHRGGAGGIDLLCSEPYTLIGECKSGKKIPNDTAVQLLNLGTIRLPNKEAFNKAVKVIIGPGEPTDQLQKAAKVHGMSIINPSTLEQLVKLHYKYPIDLIKLKDYLIDGQADDEVNRYINQVLKGVELRSYVTKLVKNYLDNANSESADISELHAVYVVSNPPQPLKREEMHGILIELSSPLAGYLGRIQTGSLNSDRYYYLRDLTVE